MATTDKPLTSKQREVLAVLATTDVWTAGPAILILLRQGGIPAADLPSRQGMHMTAASLVRRQLARKTKISGAVHYRITNAGTEEVEGW